MVTPYLKSVFEDLQLLAKNGAEVQPYLVAPPAHNVPQAQLALTQQGDPLALQALESNLRQQVGADGVSSVIKRAARYV